MDERALPRIRTPQLEALALARLAPVIEPLRVQLGRELAAQLALRPPGALDEVVALAVAKARAHHIDTEDGLYALARIILLVGPRFDEHPVVAEVLADRRVPANARLMRLFVTCSEDVWNEAAAWGRARAEVDR